MSGPGCALELFTRKFSLSLSLSLFVSLWLSHILVCYLTLAPLDYPQGIQAWSLPKACSPRLPVQPCSLLEDRSIWATYPLGAVVRCVICGFYVFIFLLVMLPSEIPKLPTDPPVRGFPGVWKLLLLHDSLPGMGLHP